MNFMAQAPRILVIDDEEDLRNSVADVIRILVNADVVECPDGPAAIQAHQERPADMVVIDYRMPQMNGLQTSAVLRKMTPGVGIILFTAYHDTGILAEARRDGIDFVLGKPAQAEDLVAAVQAVLARIAGRAPEWSPPTVN